MAAALLLASFAPPAQRVEGDRARAEGIYATEVPGQRPGRGRAQFRLRPRAGAGAGQALRRPRRGLAARASARSCARPRPTSRATTTARTRAWARPARRASAPRWWSASTRRRSTSWPRPWASRSGRSRGPSRCCGWRSTTAAARAWSACRRSNAARPALNRATERGYKLGLPTGNAAEQAAVGAIWRGDSAAVARASAALQPADAADRQALPRRQGRLEGRLDLRRRRQGAVELVADRHRSAPADGQRRRRRRRCADEALRQARALPASRAATA